MAAKNHFIVGVMGSHLEDSPSIDTAEALGYEIAIRGYVLITGGGTGVMRSASKGAKKAGGLVIGILPNDRNRPIPGYPNEFVDIPIYTGLYEARNIINVKTPHVVVALSGGAGTISEMALAVKSGTPLISFGAPVCELEKSDFFRVVNSLEETLDEIEKVRQDIER